jgi:flagellar biogenesis protein FliO
MKRCHCHLPGVLGLLTLLDAAPVAAQQALQPLATGSDAIGLPTIGRVLIAFIIAAVLAIAAGWILRRWVPKLTGSMFAAGGRLRVLERLQLGGDLRVHLVQTEHGKVLITAHRNSISVVLLDSTTLGAP